MKYFIIKNKRILVDDDDYEWLSKFKWNIGGNGYVYTSPSKYAFILMHRLILNLSNKKKSIVDHINGNPLDNRKSNLRECHRSGENLANRRKQKGLYSSKYKGVSWGKSRQKWISSIGFKNKSISLGRFDKEIDAAKAYNAAARKYFGQFALLNKI